MLKKDLNHLPKVIYLNLNYKKGKRMNDHQLIFSSERIQSGFTNASISASNDRSSSTIVREILQNSYDSAINEAGEPTAKVKFIIDYISKSDIPGIKEYEHAISLIEKEDLRKKEQERDILNTIKEQLKKEKIPVLYVIDNGVGFTQNKLVAILSDGISDKDNPNDSGGSYGNGHFSVFNMSDLRYIIYGGKFNDGSKLCSGQALLRTYTDNDDLKSATGLLLTNDKSVEIKNDIFYKDNNIPNIISSQLDTIENSGAVVGVLGFNFFGNDNSLDKVIQLISSSIVRNFYAAIYENHLEVEIATSNKNVQINAKTLDDIFLDTKDEKSKPSYNLAKQFYDLLRNGRCETIPTLEGEVKIYFDLSESSTKLAICRNGMWINDALPSPLYKTSFPTNKTFNALILAQKSTKFSALVRRAESNSHDNLQLNRFSNDKEGKEKRARFSNALAEIKDFLENNVEKNDYDSFEYEIPELAITMIGDSKSKKDQKRKSNKTKSIPIKPKTKPTEKDSQGEDTPFDPNDLKPSPPNPNPPNPNPRKGNPFEIGRLSAFHNTKSKEAKLKFVVEKNATNLLIALRLEDGTDPSCDKLTMTPRLTITKASNSGKTCKVIHNDTVDVGKVDKDTIVELSVNYETDVKGDYTIDYEFLNSALKKDNK